MYGKDVRMQTFVVVVETKDDKGNVTAVSELQTVVARDAKSAEMAAVVALAKVDKFTEGMEPTAIPFASLAQGWANKTSKSPS
jgi:RecB family endonuclease NucS